MRKASVITLAVLFAVSLFPLPVEAGPIYGYHITYWDGCGASMTLAGTEDYLCSGASLYNGTQDGHWMTQQDEYCDTGTWLSMQVWEKCNGVWVASTASAFNSGTCSC